MKKHFLFYLARAFFAVLFVYEVLNWLGILHYSLEFTWLGLVLTSGLVWLACELVMKKFSHDEMPSSVQGLAFLGAAAPVYADALADMNRWYGSISHFDKYLHFLGGVAAAGLVILIVSTLAKRKKPEFTVSNNWVAWISFLIALALGVLYEFEEYLEDVFTGSSRSGGSADTASDLLFDAIGAALVVVTVWLVWKSKKTRKKSSGAKKAA